MQGRVDEAYGNFVKALARNRNVAQSHVNENFGKGRMVTAAECRREGWPTRSAPCTRRCSASAPRFIRRRPKRKSLCPRTRAPRARTLVRLKHRFGFGLSAAGAAGA
jgi:hypothetical protein